MLWQHSTDGSPPRCIASIVVAIPCSDSAQTAETTGCRAGLSLLDDCTEQGKAARVVGDNLAAVRYGAGTGRYRRLHLCAQMDQALRPLASKGWTLTWQAVRRRLNKGSDSLATLGVLWADRLKQAGIEAMQTWVVWHGQPHPAPPPHFPARDAVSLDPHTAGAVVTRLEDQARRARNVAPLPPQ